MKMSNQDQLKMHSPNLVDSNIEKISALFPNCITETKDENGELKKAVDFDLLKQELSQVIVEGEQERYRLDWVGKKESILTANAPIAKTLRPCREESVNFDKTENLFIEGDNLEALKLLQENYLGKVKMIYIDPPYNTGNDFIYEDDFAESTDAFFEKSNQVDEEGNRLVALKESEGRYHSKWLSMMYSRLKLARNLLSDNGVIFISIDDNEIDNVKKIGNEIFGSNNFVACLTAVMNLKGNHDALGFSDTHEYIVVYAKNVNKVEFNQFDLSEEEIEAEWLEDEWGLYKKADTLRRTGQDAARSKRPKGFFPVFITENNEIYVTEDDKPKAAADYVLLPINEEGDELSWSWGKKKITEEPHNLIVTEGRNGKNIYKKQRPALGDLPTKKPKSLLYKAEYSSSTATNKLKELLGKKVFDGPKPVPLLMDLCLIGSNDNDIILDFFAGSGTTGHAVMELNKLQKTKRKFILIQLPEDSSLHTEASAQGFNNIAQITKLRLKNVGEILDSTKSENGFRVLKIDSTNMKDVYYTPDNLKQADLLDLASNIKEDRTSEDLLFQVMLDWGLELSLPIERKTIAGKEVFYVAGNSLVACFDDLTFDVVDEVAKDHPLRFVSAEKAIHLDHDKTNIKERFKQLSPDTEVKFL